MQTLPHPAHHAETFIPALNGLEQSLGRGSVRRVDTKEFVFVEGDPAIHVFKVESGAIALYKVLMDGRRRIIGFAYPGDLIGLGARGEHIMNAQAIKPSRLRCVPIASLHRSAAQDAKLAFRLYEAMTREVAESHDLMLITTQRSAMERVASFLLALSRRNERNGDNPAVIELPMTRTDIGDFLGLTIETVSRTFTKLRTLGYIALQQSNRIKLTDITALEAFAESEHQDTPCPL
jgi:CRP/FNR family transcriptional regulator